MNEDRKRLKLNIQLEIPIRITVEKLEKCYQLQAMACLVRNPRLSRAIKSMERLLKNKLEGHALKDIREYERVAEEIERRKG